MNRPTKILLAALAVVAIAAAAVFAIIRLRQPDGNGAPTAATASPMRLQIADPFAAVAERAASLRVRLSAGQPELISLARPPLVTGDPLNEAEIAAILARLPALPAAPEDTADFSLPPESLPPPRPGETVAETFPPATEAGGPTAVPGGPLEVLRYAPEGDVDIAPFLSVTFNQPMVPLATIAQLTAADVPVQMTPALPGSWRWLGARTLQFEYRAQGLDRLPMATEYTVTVPAGTTSVTGGQLGAAVSWRFRTPPPSVQTFYPQGDAQPLDPLFFVSFDQLVEPTAVLATMRVQAGGQNVAVRLATADEVAADEQVQRLAADTLDGRWLAFRPQSPLPADTAVTVAIGPGTPSAEGPLTTETADSFSLRTYAPLRIVAQRCGWEECRPLMPFDIQFNNPLDPQAFQLDQISIEPALPGAVVGVSGSSISVQGATQGQTSYTVTVDGGVRDIFGQTLGETAVLTFQVEAAEPLLSGPDRQWITLDPSAPQPAVSVYSINYARLRVRAFAVTPADWEAYANYRERYYSDEQTPTPPGELALDEEIRVGGEADVLTETAVDLSSALNGQFGHLILIVEPAPGLVDRLLNRYERPIVQTWVQVTQIAVDAFVDGDEMVAWTTALADGAPLPGVTIELGAGGRSVTSGADGTVRFDLPGAPVPMLVARQGADAALLPYADYYWRGGGWQAQPRGDEARWSIFDDRGMYRPGETVHVKGWVRRIGAGAAGDVALIGGDARVRYQLFEPQGNLLTDGEAPLSALGGFDFAFTLPDNVNLGYAQIQFQLLGGELSGAGASHSFQIQQFRRPEFEVAARNETPGPYYAAEHAVVAVTANYYAGGALPNAEVAWTVRTQPGSYAPPNWPDFTFGRWTPWWFSYRAVMVEALYAEQGFPPPGGGSVETFSGVTDAGGAHYLRLDFDAPEEPQPVSVLAEASVMDVNRQAWAAATSLLVHPARLYVGLRSERYFVRQGTPLEVDAIVVDVDGAPAVGRAFTVEAARLEWQFRNGSWGEEAVDVQTCEQTAAAEPVTCRFTTDTGGEYRITASVRDDEGRLNQSIFTRWVSGGQQPPARNVEQETLTLIPDRESYQPGDVAEILVQAPFSPAEGLLIISRGGILRTERFRLEGDAATLRIPIEAAHIPNLDVQVDVVGAAPRVSDVGEALPDLPARPAYATGQLTLEIPPLSRELSVAVAPAESALEPGGSTTLAIVVQDANGRAVPDAEVAVVVVDEAILALSNYQLTNPLDLFYTPRYPELNSSYGRRNVILANPDLLTEMPGAITVGVERVTMETAVEEAEMMAMAPAPAMEAPRAPDDAAQTPITVRSDFNPLALFAPVVRTDAQGRATVPVQLPDNLTRYRIMAVAVAGESQFGAGESNLTARLPLMVRPAAPRFLNFGDRFELPVVVQNQTDAPLSVEVVVEASNLELGGGAGRRVEVPANDRVEVRFPATTSSPGAARVQFAAVSGAYVDAAVVTLPVYTPATTEAFATYGVLDVSGAIAQPVAAPAGVFTQFGGLEINTSATALQALTDAVLYLVDYPFAYSEQLASRILAIAALRDVLDAFDAAGLPEPAALAQAVQADVEQLQQLQNGDGGFPIWQRGRESVPFYAIHAAHALQRAQAEGFTVNAAALDNARAYLRDVESHYPDWYGQEMRWSLSAYALLVRERLNDGDHVKAARLLDEAGLERLPLEAAAWLWQVLADDGAYAAQTAAIRRHFENRAVETAGAATFATGYGEQAYLLLHSERRADAVILEALIAAAPQSDLIPKVVNGLLGHQVRGRWNNTQENVFVLLALDRYFETFEAQTPAFVARIWLGETYAGSHSYVGRTTERHATEIPMAYLAETADGAAQELILSKEGPGRLYYRLGLTYAPMDLALEPLDQGFVVERVYEAVDDPADVVLDADGTWRVRAGARVRVRLTLVADSRRTHAALVDPLPAGLEIVNPALAVAGSVPPLEEERPSFWWWYWTWYDHQNLRDERAEAFATLLPAGIYEYSYVARATTPGVFCRPAGAGGRDVCAGGIRP
jgi:alpha-2-macroglobulin